MTFTRTVLSLICAVLLTSCDSREPQAPEGPEAPGATTAAGDEVRSSAAADTVMRGGFIYTVDASRSRAEAIAVRDGRVVFVGSDDDASSWIGDATQVVELEGKMVLPGFQDAHIHPIESGIDALTCDLNPASDVDAYLEIIADCAERTEPGAWIVGSGWSMSAFGPGARASRTLLDDVVPDQPVYLASSDGHTVWVNTRALEIAGITADTPDPEDGHIDRDAQTGEPVGSLQEGASDLVEAHLPPTTPEQRLDGLRYAVEMLNSYGITAVQDASAEDTDFETYRALDVQGALSLRVVGSQWWERARGLEQIEEFIDRRNKYTQGRVDAGTVKIMQDGVMENYTAAMLEPYNLEGSPKGIPMIEPAFLKTAVAALDREGFQVHFHAIGDAAIRQCLDAVEYARSENGDSDLRHHISHLELIDPQDIPRFAGLDVVANFQPLWAYPDSYVTDLTLPFIGEERGKWLYPIGSVVESGGTIAFGSDWSVSTANPFPQIEVAVTRADPTGDVVGTLVPEQAITLEEAIVAFTINAAFVNRLDKESGSLEVGKSADLAVLDRNLFEVDPQDISETRVILTMLEGEVVYEAETGTK